MNDPKLPAPAGEALAGDAKNQGPHSLPGQRLWSPRARRGKFVSDRGRNWLSWLTDGHLLLCTHTPVGTEALGPKMQYRPPKYEPGVVRWRFSMKRNLPTLTMG